MSFHVVFAYEYPTCGSCWCAPGDSECPDWEPISDYPKFYEDIYHSQIPDFVYTIDCNPYNTTNTGDADECRTNPPQEYLEFGDDAVCALQYYNKCKMNNERSPLISVSSHYEATTDNIHDDNKECYWSYKLQSYPSWEEAETDGAFVTHIGSCGVCSTTWDLAGYMGNPTLEEDAIQCTVKGLKDFDAGIQCYIDAGLTEECAKMWLYDGYHTTKECTEICVAELVEDEGDVPANGPPPECTLSDCLQCDEDVSGPIFKQYAGRIRRSSGLLSSIIRECDGFPQIIHDPCPNITLHSIDVKDTPSSYMAVQ